MNEERKLASIQRIEKLENIEGADFIQKCKLYNLEWQFVVRKGEFKVNDLCVYFEIDSLLPEREEFEFMRERKFRVKTIKLKKVISQGLCMPVSEFKELNLFDNSLTNKVLGLDVTDTLGVKKYLTPTERNELLKYENKRFGFLMRYFHFKRNKKRGRWPAFVSKTDEVRVQVMNYKDIYEQFKGLSLNVTEKIDYQSATFFTKNNKRSFLNFIFRNKKYFSACSRNIWLKKEDNSLYWKIARKYDIERILKEQKNEFIIQGEQGGPGIQDNKYGLSDPKMWVFNIIEIRYNIPYHYDYMEMEEFCKKYDLDYVPLVDNNFYLPEDINELVEYSKGKSVLNKKIMREGVVIRCVENGIKKLSFKVVNPEFLLKYGD